MKSEKAPNKHHLKSEATRAAILRAAENIFARDGYESAQIDEIGRESGRTRGAIYAKFKTKEQLFFAVQQQRVENAARDVYSFLSKIDKNDYAKRLSALRQYFASPDSQNGAILDLEMKLFALRHAASVEKWREHYLRMFAPAEFKREFGIKEEVGRPRVASRIISLGAAKSGLIVAMKFLPNQLTAKETSLILTEIFDGVFPRLGLDSTKSKPNHRSIAGQRKRKRA